MTLAQRRQSPAPSGARARHSTNSRSDKKVLDHHPKPASEVAFEPSPSDTPGERLSIQVGCLTEREAIKKRLEPKKATASRGKGAKRKMMNYVYIEYWFHWKEQSQDGKWLGRSCYLGGHPKGRAPRGKLVIRIDTIEAQKQQDRPYGETLALIGMADKIGQQGRFAAQK
jgi:hypothetical protein